VLEVLIKQFELARVDESKEGPLIQVVDAATPPEKKSKPKKSVIVLVSAFAGLFLSILAAFLKRNLRQMQLNPESAEEWTRLKAAWRWSS